MSQCVHIVSLFPCPHCGAQAVLETRDSRLARTNLEAKLTAAVAVVEAARRGLEPISTPCFFEHVERYSEDLRAALEAFDKLDAGKEGR